MDRRRGFTLLEMAITIAVIAIIAATAAATFRAARRNASVGATAFELGELLRGLKLRALAEKKDYVAVLVNPEGDDSTRCGPLDASKCLRLFLLHTPAAAWTLDGFDPEEPATNARVEERRSLAAGIVLDVGAAGTAAPAPFASVKQLATQVKGDCEGATCVAIRFDSSGEVSPEQTGTTDVLAGTAFGLRSDLDGAGADRRAILVSFPTGIVKSFQY